jgi:phosphatidylethanolamine/phosphatidyl-N-methylethanolamine N-methyltransferase
LRCRFEKRYYDFCAICFALSQTFDMTTRDALSFFCAWVSNPSQVGAVAPSGAALAELMSSEITAASGPVVELGPGTGVFTRALLACGVKEKDLTLVEHRSDFAKLLQERFPEARVLSMDAARLRQHELFENSSVGAVVSGLPLLNMSPAKVIGVLTGAFRFMRRGGAFYQFTYGPRCPVPRPYLDRLGLKATYLGRAMFNVPPAAVYRITSRKPIRTGA